MYIVTFDNIKYKCDTKASHLLWQRICYLYFFIMLWQICLKHPP